MLRKKIFATTLLSIGLTACRARDYSPTSDLANNGTAVEHPEKSGVIPLLIEGKGLCTATIVNAKPQLLTAAHCFQDYFDQPNIHVAALIGGERYIPMHIAIHPDYKAGRASAYDFAVLSFAQRTPVPEVLYLSDEPFKPLHSSTVIGYGQQVTSHANINNLPIGSSGVLRSGVNNSGTIFEGELGLITLEGVPLTSTKKDNVTAAEGDSGGPLLQDGKIVGICTAGSFAGPTKTIAVYAHWSHEPSDGGKNINRIFIDRILGKNFKDLGVGERIGYFGYAGFDPPPIGFEDTNNVVEKVRAGSRAERSGIKVGDKIIAIGGIVLDQPNAAYTATLAMARQSPAKQEIEIERDGKKTTIKLVP